MAQRNRKPLRLPKIPRRVRYPAWSIATVTQYAVIVAGLTAILVYALGKRSVFFETELVLAIIAAALFLFLATGLYRGVRVRRRDLPGLGFEAVSIDQLPDMPSLGDVGDVGVDGDEGCLAGIVGFVLAVVVGILLLGLLWVLLQLGLVLWIFLFAALSWVFYLALRQVFAKSRACQGNLARSAGYALLYTVLYTGWLFAVVFIAEGLLGPRLGGGGGT